MGPNRNSGARTINNTVNPNPSSGGFTDANLQRAREALFRHTVWSEPVAVTSGTPFTDAFVDEDDGQPDVDIKSVMKVRHLTKSERQNYHKPTPDFIHIKDKEVCRATHVLEVDDLIDSIK